ncbi:MAG: radical SAM protein, partial [Candidatus Eisenbacteria bacterium]|nr:radical SAM protein [Candidatus Eisenbacteria bacterium]
MIGVLAAVPLYKSMRATGWPRLLPLNLTVGVTYRCNSRCLTCKVYEKESGREFDAEEFDRVFASLGRAPYWFTMSGGEPFLRNDLPRICESAWRRNRPGIINIPTNGLLSGRIPGMVEEIAGRCRGAQIIVNLSLDEVGERHDRIRGVPGGFEKAIATYEGLRKLDAENLTLGVHTVVSVHNVDRIPDVYRYVQRELAPDSFITEVAEERVELGTVGAAITPEPAAYAGAIDFLIEKIRAGSFSGISKVTQSFRIRYYEMVKRFLETGARTIPCYAGVASAQMAPDGDVWFCCIRAESMGNLRDVDYDFRRIWFGEKARRA